VLEYFIVTKKDVTSLKVARDIKLLEGKFRVLLENTPDAILIVNVTGRIVLANAQAQHLFGYAGHELAGQPVEALLPPRYRQAHLGHRGAFFAHPRTRSMGASLELFGQRREGSEFQVEISLSPLDTEEGTMVMCAVRDIEERQEARRRADRKFRDLLESAPDAMVIVDAAGSIVLVNSQTVTLFGWKHDELVGKPVETLVPQRFRGAHGGHRSGFFARPKMRQMGAGLDLFGLRKDNSEFPVEISLSPILTEDGPLIASTIRDATERKRSEQILMEANRLKSEFLASMSHELRTPLNGILGFSELLVDLRFGPLNDKQREYIADINECGKHLLQLINDVLDLSKVEAGKMELHVEPCSPRAAMSAVCTLIAPLAQKKKVRLSQTPGTDVDQAVLDVQKFKQILFNLLSNAVKFTDAGGTIEIGLQADEPDRLRLVVSDTGIGIAAEDMGRLFEAFRQLDGGLARRFGGTGLGLALTKKIVELQGGSIEVQSEPGKGSTFTVLLPRHPLASQEATA
jgi:PAS domain S-box-containing protein